MSAPGQDSPTRRPILAHGFYEFFSVVEGVFRKAQAKGYSQGHDGDGRDLLDFVKTHFPGHAEGEVVYKMIRWSKKHDLEDLEKATAWLFLLWDQERARRQSGRYAKETADLTGAGADIPQAPREVDKYPIVDVVGKELAGCYLSPVDAERIISVVRSRVRG